MLINLNSKVCNTVYRYAREGSLNADHLRAIIGCPSAVLLNYLVVPAATFLWYCVHGVCLPCYYDIVYMAYVCHVFMILCMVYVCHVFVILCTWHMSVYHVIMILRTWCMSVCHVILMLCTWCMSVYHVIMICTVADRHVIICSSVPVRHFIMLCCVCMSVCHVIMCCNASLQYYFYKVWARPPCFYCEWCMSVRHVIMCCSAPVCHFGCVVCAFLSCYSVVWCVPVCHVIILRSVYLSAMLLCSVVSVCEPCYYVL